MPTIVITVEVPLNFGEPGSDQSVVMGTQTQHDGKDDGSGRVLAEVLKRVREALEPPPTILGQPIQALELGAGVTNRLLYGVTNANTREPVNTVGQLVEKTADDLLGYLNFGPKKLGKTREVLARHGLKLRGDS